MSGYTVDEAAMVVLYVAGSWWFLFLFLVKLVACLIVRCDRLYSS